MTIVIKILFALVVFAAGSLLLRSVNVGKDQRGRQALIVFFTPFLALAEALAANALYTKIRFTADSWLYGAEGIVWNLILIAVFVVVKLLLVALLQFLQKKKIGASLSAVGDTWYTYDATDNAWFLHERYQNLRVVYSALSWAIAIICAGILMIKWLDSSAPAAWGKAYPCAALIIITELFNFLNGYTRKEYAYSISGDKISAKRCGKYHKLRSVYETMFPNALLVSHTGLEYSEKQGATALINAFQVSDDATDRIVGKYFSSLGTPLGLFDVDLITAVSNLLHGRSTVILNPFYHDLDAYFLLPILDSLLHNKKCLVVVGRRSLGEDVSAWVEHMLKEYSRARDLWRVAFLKQSQPDCEVGILTFTQLYDLRVLRENEAFFSNVGFVLMIEPSRMLTTSQSGLSILAEKFNHSDMPTYCICDHEADGLVDTLSHVLQASITDVTAPPIPRSVYSIMGWEASGDFMRQKLFGKQTHYLGNGIELAAVALKNQIPHITWYSEEKAPVQDIRWIAGQYYPQICKYAHLPNQQISIDERIHFSSNLWSAEQEREAFIIAEDELCNLFATFRAYLTRGEAQSFVHVISENYLLRDYMRYNRRLFMTDPKAIPQIAPHYAKTERNTVLRLILMMASSSVSETFITHELSLLGYEPKDVYNTLTALIQKYTFVPNTIITVQLQQDYDNNLMPVLVNRYSITERVFEENFERTLKNAYFVVEDEKLDTKRIDARLFEHITQLVMPGQFITCDGKLYRVHAVSPEIGCILRRAADSYLDREYYRQIRCYHLENDAELLHSRKMTDVEIVAEKRSFCVTTTGYLAMRDNQDLRSARLIDLSADPGIDVFRRCYKNKTVISIKLPETDVRMRFTVCVLFNELFRTLFPESWQYLAVLSARPADIEGMLDMFCYRVDGAIDENLIYIIEDSDIDLGLLEAVSDELQRMLEIIADYLTWHFEKIREPAGTDRVINEVQLPEDQKRKSFFSRIAQRIMRLFSASDEKHADELPTEEAEPVSALVESDNDNAPEKGDPQENVHNIFADEDATCDAPAASNILVHVDGGEVAIADATDESEQDLPLPKVDDADDKPAETDIDESPTVEALPAEEEIVLHMDGKDLFNVDGVSDDLDLLMPITPSRYQAKCFLKLGYDEIDARLAIEEVKSYLCVRGYGNNSLTRARKRKEIDDSLLDMEAENHCDFCGLPLSGVSFELLADGRTRCNDCSMTAIDNVEEFQYLFRSTEIMLEDLFGINIRVSIAVKTVDAGAIARRVGEVFQPSTDVAIRTLGFAQRKNGRYSLFVENGSPRLAAVETISHELTHIWQYLNWDDSKIQALYGNGSNRDIVYEGMASWVSIQLLYAMGELAYAQLQERIMEHRQDVYGVGFRLYRERFGLNIDEEIGKATPFTVFPPLGDSAANDSEEED